MPSTKEDLPITGTQADQDITFDELQHFWDEIDRVIQPYPVRQEGDISARDLLLHFKRPVDGNYNWAYERMDMLVEHGDWEKINVFDLAMNRKVIVIRRKQN